MGARARAKRRIGLIMALPNPGALACDISCLGRGPFLQVLGEIGRLESEVSADAGSVEFQGDPAAVAGLLLKSQSLAGVQASRFFDPATERIRRLLGEGAKILPSFKTIVPAAVLSALTAFTALVPLKRNFIPVFIQHEQSCVLRADHP